MSSIDDFLFNLVQGSTHIISSPDTIEQLQKKGVKFDQIPQKSEAEINSLVEAVARANDPPATRCMMIARVIQDLVTCWRT